MKDRQCCLLVDLWQSKEKERGLGIFLDLSGCFYKVFSTSIYCHVIVIVHHAKFSFPSARAENSLNLQITRDKQIFSISWEIKQKAPEIR